MNNYVLLTGHQTDARYMVRADTIISVHEVGGNHFNAESEETIEYTLVATDKFCYHVNESFDAIIKSMQLEPR